MSDLVENPEDRFSQNEAHIETRDIIEYWQQLTKVFVSHRGCTCCSAPLLFVKAVSRDSHHANLQQLTRKIIKKISQRHNQNSI